MTTSIHRLRLTKAFSTKKVIFDGKKVLFAHTLPKQKYGRCGAVVLTKSAKPLMAIEVHTWELEVVLYGVERHQG